MLVTYATFGSKVDLMAEYLITGGCGFIGSHLADLLLAQGHQVRVLDNLSTGVLTNVNAAVDVIEGDINNADDVAKATKGIAGCFHLAAISSVTHCDKEWAVTQQTNIIGTINIIEALCKKSVPLVFASSSAVYGDPESLPIQEKSKLKPISVYALGKLYVEQLLELAREQYHMPTFSLRLFNVYGPRQSPDSSYAGVIAIFIRQLMAQQDLTVYGDGEQVRDFVYVADAVNCLFKAMHALEQGQQVSQPVNVCAGKSISINELVTTLSEVMGCTAQIDYAQARNQDIHTSVGDPQQLQDVLGCTCATTLAEGLQLMSRYHESA